jgi:hypothetical protein
MRVMPDLSTAVQDWDSLVLVTVTLWVAWVEYWRLRWEVDA